jgi:hypothetical protein
MRTHKVIYLVLLLLLIGSNSTSAKGPESTMKNSILNKAAIQEWKFFDINTIYCTINSAGPYADYLRTNSSGLFWPKGTNKTAVFTAGIWIIGKHRPTGGLRTAVQDYSTEFQPGPILTQYNTTTNSSTALGDPTDPRYKIYKVHRKDSVGGVNPDYDNWPVDLGAPYTERNDTPGYQAGEDKPFLWGDQVLWCVYNDGNAGGHSATGRTNPMGIEVQTTYFGFDQPGALGNIMFMRWKIINKSDADYDSVFISMWSDTDLGDAGDDLAAIDTLRKLAYVYNATNNDAGASGYGSRPPACGFVFFQGPEVPGAPTDTALFEGKKRGGTRNLPGTSHVVYFNGGGGLGWNDPPLGNIAFAEQAYNLQNGFVGATGAPFINPDNSLASKFVFPGDPVTGTGWTHLKTATAQDVRSMISSGPFTLAKGDTQEIVGGFVIAQGAERLGSVSILRLFTAVAQDAFDVNFQLASPPPQPVISIGEYPNKAILNWGDPKAYEATETYNFTGAAKNYKFEGYNVFQLKGPSSTFDSKLVATYDVVNNVKTVIDNVIDNETGLTLPKPVVFGDDYGVKRFFVIDKDHIAGGPLINGKEYYFAVTSYAYNHDPNGITSGIPQVLENSKTVMTVIPRTIAAGEQLGTNINQRVFTNRAINGDDAVVPLVIDPKQTTGGTYEIVFNGLDTNVTSWSLLRTGLPKGSNSTATDTLVKNSTNFTGDDVNPLVDGIMWKVTKPKAGPRRDSQEPKGYRYYPSDNNNWFTGKTSVETLGNMDSTFSRSIGYPMVGNFVAKQSKVKPWDLKKVEIRFSNTNTQKAYRYVDFNSPAFGILQLRDSSFLPYLKHRGAAGAFVYQDFVDIPLTAWEIDSLDGSPAPRQLNVGFLEKNDTIFSLNGSYIGKGAVNGKWGPTHGPSGGSEVLFIFASDYVNDTLPAYTRNPTAPANNAQFLNMRSQLDSVDVYYAIWVKRKDSLATFKEGDRFVITPNYPLIASRTYGISVPKNIKNDPALISEQIEKINVFPNPYFANNKAESNVYQRFVTFTNLPQVATIRIINLAGERLKTIYHNNNSGFERWDLRNESGLPVASGMYIAYIEIPNAGNRTLKLAIIQPEERPAR